VYDLALDLHGIGIVHGDLKPRNVARVRGGGFRLIDFSESRNHVCKENKVQYVITSLLIAVNIVTDCRTTGFSSSADAEMS
jgi:serine/threonine protein kinase